MTGGRGSTLKRLLRAKYAQEIENRVLLHISKFRCTRIVTPGRAVDRYVLLNDDDDNDREIRATKDNKEIEILCC
jgi:hypothetical protein